MLHTSGKQMGTIQPAKSDSLTAPAAPNTAIRRLRLRFGALGEGLMALCAMDTESSARHLKEKARLLRSIYDQDRNEDLQMRLWHGILYPAIDLFKGLIKENPSVRLYLDLAECYRLLPFHHGYQQDAREAFHSAISLADSQEKKEAIRKMAIASFVDEAGSLMDEALHIDLNSHKEINGKYPDGWKNVLSYHAAVCCSEAAQLEPEAGAKSRLYESALEAFATHGDGMHIVWAIDSALAHATGREQVKRLLKCALPPLIRDARAWALSDEIGQGMILTVAALKYSALANAAYVSVPTKALEDLSIADMLSPISLSDEQISAMRKIILEMERISRTGSFIDDGPYRRFEPLDPDLVSKLLQKKS